MIIIREGGSYERQHYGFIYQDLAEQRHERRAGSAGQRRRAGMSRKLDAAIAEALGKTVARIDYEKYSKYVIPGNKSEQQRGVPHYSTDGNAMLELEKEMRAREFDIKIEFFPAYGKTPETWDVEFMGRDNNYYVYDVVGEMPYAVALAAYKALTGKEWTE